MTQSATSSRKAIGRERELQALELRKAGFTFDRIAQQLGISQPGAYKAVKRALSRLTAQTDEAADEVRRLELERLDGMLPVMWTQAKQGNQGAVDRVLRIMERRARLLGLDAPAEVKIGGRITQVTEQLVDAGDACDGEAVSGANDVST